MNGWSNKQTWIVVNYGMNEVDADDVRHIIDDEGMTEYQKIDAIAVHMRDNFESYAEDTYGKIMCGSNPVSELFTHAVNMVNWYELAHTWYYDNVVDAQ